MFDQTALALDQQPALLAGVVFVLGLLVGSFLNVVIYRLPVMMQRDWQRQAHEILHPDAAPPGDDEAPFNIVAPRSRCPHCGHGIGALENVPILSWLVLRGRCASCRAPIPMRYPMIELLTGILSCVVALEYGFTLAMLAGLVLTWTLIALAFIDLDTQLLPDSMTVPLLFAGLLLSASGAGFTDATASIYGAVAGYMVLWIVFHVFKAIDGREGLGYGDFKLLAALGAWFGWQALPVITVLAAGVGTLVAGAMIVSGRQQRDVPMAFGPYLAGAGYIMLVWGDALGTLMYGTAV